MANSGNTNLSIDEIISLKKTIQDLIDNDVYLNNKTAHSIKELLQLYDDNFSGKREDLEEILRTSESMRLLFQDMGSKFKQQYEIIKNIDNLIHEIVKNTGLEKDSVQEILPLYKEWLDLSDKKLELEKNFDNLNDKEIDILAEVIKKEKEKKEELLSSHAGQELYKKSLIVSKDVVEDILNLQKELKKIEKEKPVKQQKELLKKENELLKKQKAFEKERDSWKTGYKWIDDKNFVGKWLSKSKDGNELMHKKNLLTVLKEVGIALKNIGKQGLDKWREVDQMTLSFGRKMGMNREEMDKFREHTIYSYEEIAKTLGMESKEMFKFQEQFSENTQRAVMLTEDQLTSIAGLSRYVGDEAVSLAEQNLDVLSGGNADATVDYLAKGMAKATRSGLQIKAYSEAFAKNIKLASKYNFKDGINGIQRMTLLTQRLKVDMASIASAMDKFSTIESSIETGAQIQVLGGSFSNNYGNSMQVMAESLLDPEAFTQRIINTVSPLVRFDEKTGEYQLSPADKLRLNAFAKNIGIDYQEIFNMATQEHKLSQIKSTINTNNNFSEEDWSYIANKAQFRNNQWVIRTPDGKDINVKEIKDKNALDDIRVTDETDKLLANKVSDIHAILKARFAKDLTFNEKKQGYEESWKLSFSKIWEFASPLLMWSVPFIAGWKTLGVGNALGGIGRGIWRNKKIGSGIERNIGPSGKPAAIPKGKTSKLREIATQNRSKGINRTILQGQGLKTVDKFVKHGGAIAAITAVGASVMELSNHSDRKDDILQNDSLTKKEKAKAIKESEKERNKGVGGTIGGGAGGWMIGAAGAKAGAAIGTAIAPGLGTAIGGILGGLVGGAIGYFGGSKVGEGLGGLVSTDGKDDVEEYEKENNRIASANNKSLNNVEDDVHYIASVMSSQRPFNNQAYYKMDSYHNTRVVYANSYTPSLKSINSEVNDDRYVYAREDRHEKVVRTNSDYSYVKPVEIDFSDIQIKVGGKIDLQPSNHSNWSLELDKALDSPQIQKRIASIVQTEINYQFNNGVAKNNYTKI